MLYLPQQLDIDTSEVSRRSEARDVMGEVGQSPALSRNCSNEWLSHLLEPDYPPLSTL